jgi:hypothetical protein
MYHDSHDRLPRAGVATALLVFCAGAGSAQNGGDARYQFTRLQQLEGDWVLAATQEGEASKHPVIAPLVGSGKVALSYRLVGARTTVQENIFPGTPREMATMYHCVDSACTQVVANHYCTLKNQPVLRADPRMDVGRLVFRCDPGVAVCASPDAHLHVLTIEMPEDGSNRLKTKFQIQKEGKPAEELVFLFDRKP